MAEKPVKSKAEDTKANNSLLKSVQNIIDNLGTISSNTTHSTYGVSRDIYDTERLLDKFTLLQNKNNESVKKVIDGNNFANSRLNSTVSMLGGKNANRRYDKNRKVIGDVGGTQPESVFDLISSRSNIFQELRQQLLIDNKFSETIAEYETLRRAIPEVSRVINLLINNVLVPDSITTNIINIDYKLSESSDTENAKKIKEKYELDKKIRVMVENYFIIGVEYITVIPYQAVIEAIKDRTQTKSAIIKESALGDVVKDKKTPVLTESAFLDMLEDDIRKKFKETENYVANHTGEFRKFETTLANHIDNIKIYKSNKKLIYDQALVESITTDKESFMLESSFDEFLSKDLKMPKTSNAQKADSAESLTSTSGYDNMKVKGCKIERLDPSRVYPIHLHDTVIAYVYIEERRDESLQYNIQNNMRNSFSFYRASGMEGGNNAFLMQQIDDRIIRTIGERVISSLSPKFVEANFKEMDTFYEFLRDNELHKYQNDIVILHPDDVIELKRTGGSIMKNATFFLKLYLLLFLNNILTKVRKGSDRTMYYVSSGLSNDIEGAVQQAIEDICQSEIRVSDVGTIQGVMQSIGSIVDLFIPQTADGEKPIMPEVISGQQVDMDEEFLKWIIKSIILSFNMPSVAVDLTNEVELAKTLSMANLDVAMTSALEQSELNPMLTKLIRQVMAYDMDLTQDEVDTIKASLIPAKSMLMQLTTELINTTKELATTMAEINLTEDDDMMKKIFIKKFVRQNFNYDWSTIDKILETGEVDGIESTLKTDAKAGELDISDLGDESEFQ